jgi:CubicO group peptidase (beta-lactamase class C family)
MESKRSVGAALQPFVEQGKMAGAVLLVSSKDGVLDEAAIGLADLTTGRAMEADAFFWVASQSKAITSTALMMLVEEKKIKVEDPVEKYLPEFRGQVLVEKDNPTPRAPRHTITVLEVLTHTSGMPFSAPEEGKVYDRMPLRAMAELYARTPLGCEPGTDFLYSNIGTNIVGRLVEVIGGLPYETFMDRRLFEPLGMRDTTFWPTPEQLARLAKTYRLDAETGKLVEQPIEQLSYPLDDRSNRYPLPAGGLFSTARDIERYCRFFLQGGELDGARLLSAASIAQMTTRHTPPHFEKSYGFGWAIEPDGAFSHGGAYNTFMKVDPARGLVMVYLPQHSGAMTSPGAPDPLATFLAAAESWSDKKPATSGAVTVIGSPRS